MARVRSRKAFTLVELLVVIGIIALLVGILLPVMNKVRQSANEAVCMSNMRQLGYGVISYANQFFGTLPYEGPDGTGKSITSKNFFGPAAGISGYNDGRIWFNAVPPLVGNKSYYDMLVDNANGAVPPYAGGPRSIFICPMAASSATQGSNDTVKGDYFMLNGIDSTGRVPGTAFPFALSYGWNSKLASSIKYGSQPSLKLSDCEPSTECVIIVEKMTSSGEYMDPSVQLYNTTWPAVYNGKINALGSDNNVAQTKVDYKRFTTRHRHGGHLLFADSHVAWFGWTDVQIPASQMPYNANTSDVNQPGKVAWSALGPVN